jgi:Protein of unknown function (DUF2934)
MSETNNTAEARIRELAYALWQQAGCPEGRDHEFWIKAQEITNNKAASDKTPPVTNDDVDRAGEHSFPASDPVNRT